MRGEQNVRIIDVTKHDVKVQPTFEEFSMLYSSSSAINNYINQLHAVESCCEDYVDTTIDTYTTNVTDTLQSSGHIYYEQITARSRIVQTIEDDK